MKRFRTALLAFAGCERCPGDDQQGNDGHLAVKALSHDAQLPAVSTVVTIAVTRETQATWPSRGRFSRTSLGLQKWLQATMNQRTGPTGPKQQHLNTEAEHGRAVTGSQGAEPNLRHHPPSHIISHLELSPRSEAKNEEDVGGRSRAHSIRPCWSWGVPRGNSRTAKAIRSLHHIKYIGSNNRQGRVRAGLTMFYIPKSSHEGRISRHCPQNGLQDTNTIEHPSHIGASGRRAFRLLRRPCWSGPCGG